MDLEGGSTSELPVVLSASLAQMADGTEHLSLLGLVEWMSSRPSGVRMKATAYPAPMQTHKT